MNAMLVLLGIMRRDGSGPRRYCSQTYEHRLSSLLSCKRNLFWFSSQNANNTIMSLQVSETARRAGDVSARTSKTVSRSPRGVVLVRLGVTEFEAGLDWVVKI